MPTFESILHWLDRLRPLTDLLIAIGTISSVIAAIYFGLRRPRIDLKVSAVLRRPQGGGHPVLDVTIISQDEGTPTVQTIYWRAPCIGPQRLYITPPLVILNGISRSLPLRMTEGDILSSIIDLYEIANLANLAIPQISQNLTDEQINLCISQSRVGCLTSTTKHFETELTRDSQQELSRAFRLQRAI